ncbi:HD domain-containing protein [bacterium]|nr:HD domain-containing protein [bacterium]
MVSEQSSQIKIDKFLNTYCGLIAQRTKEMLANSSVSANQIQGEDIITFLVEENFSSFNKLFEVPAFGSLKQISQKPLEKIQNGNLSKDDLDFFVEQVENHSAFLKQKIISQKESDNSERIGVSLSYDEVPKLDKSFFLIQENPEPIEKISSVLNIKDENFYLLNLGRAILKEVFTLEDLSKFRIEKVRNFLRLVIREFRSAPHQILKLTFLLSQEDYLIGNSLNVCFMSINSAIGLGYSDDELMKIGIASLLHDAGMPKVPEEIVRKNNRLNTEEREFLLIHPKEGVSKVMQINGLDSDVEQAIYQEHERMDGSGYPEKVWGNNIHEFAKIISVADVFESLSHLRPYRQKILPFQAMYSIGQMGRSVLDREVVKHFINRFSAFPIGSVVELSTGEKAMVLETTHNSPFRPKVKVIFTKDWRKVRYERVVDLKKEFLMQIIRSVPTEEFAKYL